MRLRIMNPILSLVNYMLIDLPSSSSLTYLWNFGSLLGLTLAFQIITGIFLAMHYCSDTQLAFASINHILRDVNYGYLLKYFHANGASFFFLCVYIHIGKGLYYNSFLKSHLWMTGVTLFLVMMITAFIGYVLPWGQMSFWGATVITNFVSAIPYIGDFIVQWIWGGFSVGNPTLNRFFSLHYLLPFALVGLTLVHLTLLHQAGSSTPIGVGENYDVIPFHPYFVIKDILGLIIMILLFITLVFYYPNLLGDPENYIKANPLVTPVHIMPEWYFLFAYGILRSIPNKLGGVIALLLSVLVLLILPFNHSSVMKGLTFKPFSKFFYWVFIANFILITWIGSKPVEEPFILIGQLSSIVYFSHFLLIIPLINKIEDYFMFSHNNH